ncbi:HAD family hydrolase [Mucisphaera sp.]|uniref:HAD family hydrolase n=1 Tax=Mucisphaera sp. TaxID=2913024 RepID=UPI003D0A6061
MAVDGVIFDLDGTLVDSLGEIAWACNRARADEELPELAEAVYRPLIGRGLRHLVEAMLGAGDERVARVEAGIRRVYAAHAGERVRIYDGVLEVLEALRERSVRMAVVTNKPDGPAKHLVTQRFGEGVFGMVVGQREGVSPKPDPAGAFEVVERLGGEATRWWFVGDMTVDVETAKRAGMVSVGVTWGFGTGEEGRSELEAAGADYVIDEPGELLGLLQA